MYTLVIIVVLLLPLVIALDNGLAVTPPMGWSSWNTLRCSYNETDIYQIADLLVSSGLAAAGYKSLNIDDCWESDERDEQGQLSFNHTRFPSGPNTIASYLHKRGLMFGLYTSSGPLTCQGYPGSWEHEIDDAMMFSQWEVDYLKLDCCYQYNVTDRDKAFNAMSDALLNTGRPIVFSCDSDELIQLENNKEYPTSWAPSICNLARIHWDIYDEWISTLSILNAAINVNRFSHPHYWNDLDILTVGMGGQSIVEYTSHFQLWCIMSSPLIMGHDLRTMSDEILHLLLNTEAISINQDILGVSGNLIDRSIDGSVEIWAKPLFYNQTETLTPSISVSGFVPLPVFHPAAMYHGVVLFNRASFAQDLFLDFVLLFDNELCPHIAPNQFIGKVRDAWNHQDLGIFINNYTAYKVPAHGSVMLKVMYVETNNTRDDSPEIQTATLY